VCGLAERPTISLQFNFDYLSNKPVKKAESEAMMMAARTHAANVMSDHREAPTVTAHDHAICAHHTLLVGVRVCGCVKFHLQSKILEVYLRAGRRCGPRSWLDDHSHCMQHLH